MPQYTPSPLDTHNISILPSLHQLMERLAENAHDVWAKQRLSEGWIYGPQRDDGAKQHPCLVAYEALPESEKTYDRMAVTQTIKAMLALGYRITPPEE